MWALLLVVLMLVGCASDKTHTYYGIYKGQQYEIQGGVEEKDITYPPYCWMQPPHAIGTDPGKYWYPCPTKHEH